MSEREDRGAKGHRQIVEPDVEPDCRQDARNDGPPYRAVTAAQRAQSGGGQQPHRADLPRPNPIRYRGVPSSKIASGRTDAVSAQRNPAKRFTRQNVSSDPVSRHAPSQYHSPTLESPKITCSKPAIQRYNGWNQKVGDPPSSQ